MDKPKIIEFAEYDKTGDGTSFSIRADHGCKHIKSEFEGVVEFDDLSNSVCFPLDRLPWIIDSLKYIQDNMQQPDVHPESEASNVEKR